MWLHLIYIFTAFFIQWNLSDSAFQKLIPPKNGLFLKILHLKLTSVKSRHSTQKQGLLVLVLDMTASVVWCYGPPCFQSLLYPGLFQMFLVMCEFSLDCPLYALIMSSKRLTISLQCRGASECKHFALTYTESGIVSQTWKR